MEKTLIAPTDLILLNESGIFSNYAYALHNHECGSNNVFTVSREETRQVGHYSFYLLIKIKGIHSKDSQVP